MNKNNTPDVLRQIADDKTAECERRKQLTPNIQQLANDAPPTRDFAGALTNNSPHAIIAEIKYKSPSRGVLRKDFSPITLAQQYQSKKDFTEAQAEAIAVHCGVEFKVRR